MRPPSVPVEDAGWAPAMPRLGSLGTITARRLLGTSPSAAGESPAPLGAVAAAVRCAHPPSASIKDMATQIRGLIR